MHTDPDATQTVFDITRPLSIEAGAGCGKTHAMVDRIVQLLSSGQTRIERLLIITFTNNAAEELRTRIRTRIEKEHDTLWARRALHNYDRAHIQTIHSFALDVCSKYSDVLGMNGRIKLFDENTFIDYSRRHVTDFFSQLAYDPQSQDILSVLAANTVNFNQLHSLFLQLMSHTTYLPGDTDVHTPISPLNAPFRELIQTATQVRLKFSLINAESLKPAQQKRVNAFHSLALPLSKAEHIHDAIHISYAQEKYVGKKRFSLHVPPTADVAYRQYEEEVSRLGEALTAFINKVNSFALEALHILLTRCIHAYRDTVFARRTLSFDDLLIATRRLLEHEEIHEELWCSFDCIFVDEFQDTDNNQLYIIENLTSDHSSDDIGRACIAGDKTQSIYSFRGANVEGYQQFVSQQDFLHSTLDVSRRSVPEIVDFTNRISDELFEDYTSLFSQREILSRHDGDLPAISFLSDEIAASSDELRIAQTRHCVSSLEQLYTSGSTILDPSTNKERTCTYDDMTIIIRDRSCMPDLQRELNQRYIPFRCDIDNTLWDHLIIEHYISITHAVAFPDDTISIVAALRTPMFSLTNDDLIAYVNEMNDDPHTSYEQLWNYQDIPQHSNFSFSTQKVISALSKLATMHMCTLWDNPSKAIHNIFSCTDFFFVYETAFSPEEVREISLFLLDHVLSYEQLHPLCTPQQYADYLSLCKETRVNVRPLRTSHDTGITILTVHGAKGLEFPIVGFIPSQKPLRKETTKITVDSNNINLHISDRLKNHSDDPPKDVDISEEKRLIYVALTRARDYLVISSPHKPIRSTKSQASILAQTINTLSHSHEPQQPRIV